MAGVLFPPRCRALEVRPPRAVRPRSRAAPLFTRFRYAVPDRMIASRRTEAGMDKELIAKLAQAAGLHKALAEFPEDVATAAEQALGNQGGIAYPTNPADEPWPPMRAGSSL